MDIGHRRVPKSMTSHKKSHKGKRNDDDSLKVVYISSPMKVRTSSSRFRSLVQELTGKNSDISRYMDANGAASDHFLDDDGLLAKHVDGRQFLSSISSSDDTTTTTTTATTTSESFLGGTMDNVFSQMEEQFAGIFSSDSFRDPSQLDVLGSYMIT